MDTWKNYICPVCGAWSCTKDRFPTCEFCQNEDVIIIEDEKLHNEIQAYLKSLTRSDFEKYLVLPSYGEIGKDYTELYVATVEYIRQKYVFDDPRFSKTKFNEREHQECARHQEYKTHKKEEIAALREEVYGEPNPYRKVTCPTCGSTNTEKISALSRGVSVGLFGIFSQKVKHQFRCKTCGYEW